MQDTYGRSINYLRISVTEACNFRCIYCAPNGHGHISVSPLTPDEIARIVRAAVPLGITNIRLTGGEPLLRRDIVEIVRAISEVDGIRDLGLTTNGFRLAGLAHSLADAGLRRVNISLDTLRAERFARVVGVDAFEPVWRAIHAADQVGLAPLKLNVVVMRGINDDEAVDFAHLTLDHEWHVRFIELMPVGMSDTSRGFFPRHFIAAHELLVRIPELEQVSGPVGNGPARTYRLPNARGTVGFITPASDHFCSICNRIRVTARGEARACLFGPSGINLRGAIHSTPADLQELLARVIASKPERHPLDAEFRISVGAMSEIGG